MTAVVDQFADFATSSVAGGAGGAGTALGTTDTTLLLPTGDGAKFPVNGPFMLLLGSPSSGSHELVKCTARSSDQLTILRAQEGTGASSWPLGTPLQEVVTAGNMTNIWNQVTQRSFNVMLYGATGNGVTDDTAAIQAAIVDAQNVTGGVVFFPEGNYLISSALTVAQDNIQLQGVSWGSQLIAATNYSIATGSMITVQAPLSASFRYGISVKELFINGSNISTLGGLQLTSTYNAYLEHLRVRYCPGVGIYFTGSPSARGAYTTAVACTITDGGAGTAYKTYYAENNTIIGGVVSWYNQTGGIGVLLQDGVNQVMNTVFDECDTGIQFYFANGNQVIGAQFTRGNTQFLYFQGATNTVVQGCYMDQFVGTANGQHMINLTSTCANNLVQGCLVNTSTGWPGFLNDNSNSGANNRFLDNQTQGLQVLLNASHSYMRGNVGWNPRGHSMTQPAVPVSGTAVTNTYGPDATVYITGGSVSVVAIGNTSTGLTSGQFRVPWNQTITLTYTSTAPTWMWFGD